MVNCQLPVTGANISMLATLGVLLVAIGIVSLLVVRRRGVGRGAAIVIALAVGATVLTFSEAPRADADSCPPTAPPVVLTPATTTTTTVPPTTTTTTTPVPDLTPSITGPLVFGPGEANYVVTVSNVGTRATAGAMTFTVTVELLTGPPPVTLENPISSSWVATGSGTVTLTFTSMAGLVIAPGGATTVGFTLVYSNENPASMTLGVLLPTGIGGETNGANNTASLTVAVPPPPG